MDQVNSWLRCKLQQHRSSCRSSWRTSVTIDCEGSCSQIKGKSKTTKRRICWCTKYHSDKWKKVDWYWTRRIFFLCVRDFGESDWSSSTLSNSTTRRRRSSSILEDQEFSSESVSTSNLLVGWSLESMLVSRRRSKKEISALHRYFRKNYLFPSSSRTFKTQSHWSFITGHCDNSEWILPAYLPHRMCF